MWNNFWGFAYFFFWIFAFVAYLIAVFSIIGDLFRDKTLNGWLKAIWFLFLIFVPFLTALVYLIARGQGLAERSEARHQAREEGTKTYVQSAPVSPAEELAKASALLDSGTITKAEFDSIKSTVLA
jgi:Phospholipase_D-nuclease N-terminal